MGVGPKGGHEVEKRLERILVGNDERVHSNIETSAQPQEYIGKDVVALFTPLALATSSKSDQIRFYQITNYEINLDFCDLYQLRTLTSFNMHARTMSISLRA